MSAARYARHVAELLAAHGLEARGHSSSGRAWRKRRAVAFRPVKSAVTYAFALHEIGHVLGPWQSGPRLVREAGAWTWAIENSLEWTEPMQRTMQKSLQSYLRWARRHSSRVALPPPGHPFWTLAGKVPPR